MNYSDIFDLRGGMYQKAMNLFPEARRLEFEIPLSICQPEAHDIIVDLPSGGGYLSDYLENKDQLICLESSQQFVSFCEEKELAVYLYENDLLPLKTDQVDVIISIAGLHHIEDKSLIFSEMRRILKPEGRLCITDVKHNSKMALFLDDVVDKYTETGHRGFYLGDETLSELSRAGFCNIKQEVLNHSWSFKSKEDMVTYCKLLFALHEATDFMVLNGIEQYLTVKETPSGVELEWELLSFSISGIHD